MNWVTEFMGTCGGVLPNSQRTYIQVEGRMLLKDNLWVLCFPQHAVTCTSGGCPECM